ncbi:type II secretion system F family protein [Mesobacillus maritimus]|uniref:Type II secretion system F family protein n=1 Tax=Mesobacillus maritimus TaxID=1643336 RepID=A0ABS7KA24_9BACI|nr:type II secretion system F family protein [Mesobacillus maritimus]MBY0099118.1 type II secretion system F family protein [Mesobacillus maritimus]
MARFKYSGRDRKGKKSGTVTAASKREAMEKLRADGIRIVDMTEVPETIMTKDLSIGNPVKLQDLVIYLRQFATLIKAGVTIVDATNILAMQTESKKLKIALEDIESELRQGRPYSDAAEKHKKIFEPIFINMVRAGEAGGNMEETLERLAEHFEKQHNTRQKIKSAMAYPVVVGIIAVAVVIFMLVSVVPTFVGMFADFGADLPAITQFVLNASEFTQVYWWLILFLAIALALGLNLLNNGKKTRYYMDIIKLKMPIFGKMLQKAALARMTRTLSSLFSSGVPILNALSIVEGVVENEVISRVIKASREDLARGRSLTGPMKEHWAFPPLTTQMISIGEETGSLDAMLSKVAEFYEKEVENSTDKLKSLIEPLMIVFLAGIVGVIVLAILTPMFDMFNHVG